MEEKIIELLEMNVSEQTIRLGHEDYPLIARIHEIADIVEKRYDDDQILLRFRMNRQSAERMKKILARSSPDGETHPTGQGGGQSEGR